MIPKKDQYVDKDGNLTDDPAKYARQVAVAGFELDDRTAKRYGIADSLVSVSEPRAVRNVMTRSADEPEKETESKPKTETSEAEAAESKASITVEKAETKKPAAKKGAKK
jgi:major membrane immunogen (membrane-anchored lipoprotein)